MSGHIKIGAGQTIPKESVQSVIFNRKYFDEPESRKWMHLHGFRTNYKPKPHITTNFIRYRQFEPIHGVRYITKMVGRGIELVILIN